MPTYTKKSKIKMKTNIVYALTKGKNLSCAKKKYGADKVVENEEDGRIYREVWRGSMRGKVKEFILSHAFHAQSYGENRKKYGYRDQVNEYYVSCVDGKTICEMALQGESKRIPSTIENEKEEWSRRLVSLLHDDFPSLDMDDAMEMAQEKLDYKVRMLEKMEERQYESFSQKRASLIRKMERENPLRRIKDKSHALCILMASKRHNGNYDSLLAYYHDRENDGSIEKGDAREFAREQCTKI